MSETLSVILLGAIQGLTEFLPISSSMHLVLIDRFVWAHDGHFDIAVHLGSLIAVMIYFWREVLRLLNGVGDTLKGKTSAEAKLFWLLILATLPVIVMGFLLDQYGWENLHSPAIIGTASLGFGLLLFVAERWGRGGRSLQDWGIPSALAIGLAQCFALIPGASRSGVTMTAALSLGFSRTEAARIALLMSMPVIAGAATLEGYTLYVQGGIHFTEQLVWAIAASFTASFIAIPAMMWTLNKIGYLPFILYRCILGLYLISFAY